MHVCYILDRDSNTSSCGRTHGVVLTSYTRTCACAVHVHVSRVDILALHGTVLAGSAQLLLVETSAASCFIGAQARLRFDRKAFAAATGIGTDSWVEICEYESTWDAASSSSSSSSSFPC